MLDQADQHMAQAQLNIVLTWEQPPPLIEEVANLNTLQSLNTI